MDIILLERIARLGQMGETATVKPGFARNFLIPQGKALPATKANVAKFEAQRKELEAKNESARQEAEEMATKLDGVSVKVFRQASETGQLFGSVKPRDIAESLAEQGITVAKSLIQIGEPIKLIGDYEVRVALHPEKVVQLPVNVERMSQSV